MNKSGEVYELRAIAFLIDFLIAFFISISLNTILVTVIKPYSVVEFINTMAIFPFVIYAVLNGILTFIFNGRTVAGMIFRLKIIDINGRKRISIKQCFLRVTLLSVYTVVIASFFYMIVNKSTRGLFDVITDTEVISVSKKSR